MNGNDVYFVLLMMHGTKDELLLASWCNFARIGSLSWGSWNPEFQLKFNMEPETDPLEMENHLLHSLKLT